MGKSPWVADFLFVKKQFVVTLDYLIQAAIAKNKFFNLYLE